ncbi:MAG: hypothetical protein QM706_00735 [Nitrospira sp.]
MAVSCRRDGHAPPQIFHDVQRRIDDVGEPRERLARLLGRYRARKNARADQEHLLLSEQAQPVEEIFVGTRLTASPTSRRQACRRRATPKNARLEQRIHHLRVLREDVGEPRRGAEDQCDERHQIGILYSSENSRCRRAVRQETIEDDERASGCSEGKMVEQDRHQFGKLRARDSPAQRT